MCSVPKPFDVLWSSRFRTYLTKLFKSLGFLGVSSVAFACYLFHPAHSADALSVSSSYRPSSCAGAASRHRLKTNSEEKLPTSLSETLRVMADDGRVHVVKTRCVFMVSTITWRQNNFAKRWNTTRTVRARDDSWHALGAAVMR